MIGVLLATTLGLHPFELVRVEDPGHPAAEARSATGAVLLEPPEDGTPWSWESVPEVTGWPATEALEALNATGWHERGITGAGVKVAVFDLQWYGAEGQADELGAFSTHDCWAHRSCELPMDTWRPRFGFEEGVHGWACAEVIRDIAPDAELHLVRVNGRTTLENAVDWAIREGIDVVSMSLSFFNTSFYDGQGPVSRQAERLAAAGGLMVVSAGNYARSNWQGHFVDADGDGRMEFDGQEGLWVYLDAGRSRGAYIAWNQYRSCGLTDLDAVLYDRDGRIVGRSADRQHPDGDRCEPNERLRGHVEQAGWYRIEVQHRRGSLVDLEVDVLTTAGTLSSDQRIAGGSVTDPGASPASFAVGAVRADGYLANDAEGFSSRGPTHGGLPKPDIGGPDGLSTDAYGPVGFYGTSAATPAVAGALALVLSADPSLTPHQAARRLQGWAWGDQSAFFEPDPRWGAGKARLPVEIGGPAPCGRRPLLLPLFLLPLAWLRRGRRAG